MSDACAIKATFSTWRPVNGRKVLQLVFEVPIEQQGEVLTMLGAPDDKWCAIAVLNLKPTEDSHQGAIIPLGSTVPRPQANEAGISKPKKRFEDYPLSQQCALTCDDANFGEFIKRREPELFDIANGDVASVVRSVCNIDSRSQLDRDKDAAKAWATLAKAYQAYLTDKQYAGARR